MSLIEIPLADLRFLDEELKEPFFEIDLVYANAGHPLNHFGQIYAHNARMMGHKDMVAVLKVVGEYCSDNFGWSLRLLDCLRTYEAQVLMARASTLPAHLLSRPGSGGHVRGMAVDVQPLQSGQPVNFGCPYDDFSQEGQLRAHRKHLFLSEAAEVRNAILANRYRLDRAFTLASEQLRVEINGLATEWWDYRVPNSITSTYSPIRDEDLPPEMRMTAVS
jgi:D-alanyl-D-alanine dipeptidase